MLRQKENPSWPRKDVESLVDEDKEEPKISA